METTFNIPSEKMRVLQDLVKQNNLRFRGNPSHSTIGKSTVCLQGKAEDVNNFFRGWDRANTQITETKSPKWKRVLRRALSYFK